MPSADILLAFLLAASIFAYMPGPSMLYAAGQTVARGQRAGWWAALGLHLGGYAHVFAAAFGLAFLFSAVPVLFAALKLAGAAYLIWLGLQMFRDKSTPAAGDVDGAYLASRRAFWQSATVEILNPKTALFYLAFLPQFTDPAADFAIWAQLVILGTLVNIMFSSADVICVVLAHRISRHLRRASATRHLAQRIGGSILIALGLKLAFSRS